MANENVTQLPGVINASLSDIIYAVQGGVDSQETLGQVLDLALTTNNLNYAGNPNGHVAGTVYQTCWDTSDNLLWVCTTSGSTTTAVWQPCVGTLTNGQLVIGSTGASPVKATLTAGTNITINNSAGAITISGTGDAGFTWTDVTGATQQMAVGNGYVADRSSLVTFTLPLVSAIGDRVSVVGKGSGGWSIVYGASQLIHVGSSASTVTTGNIASTNQWDSIQLICVTANTTWSVLGAPQGNITIV